MFHFNSSYLNKLAESQKDIWHDAEPFSHIVIDDFLPEDLALQIGNSFPGEDDIEWRLAGPGDSKHSGLKKVEKLSTSNEENFPDTIRHMMYCFQSGVFLTFLEKLTGFEYLSSDPHNFGCGLHSTGTGGRLMVHLDASRHPNKDFIQLINMIYYCNPDWKDEYGGDLELWDKSVKKCVKKVSPKFNRAVIFHTGKYSYHGHPVPTTSPEGVRRNSLAVYYYSTKKSQSDLDYTNFVEWKSVTEHDQKNIYHYGKQIVRKSLPKSLINSLAKIVRKVK